MGSDSQKAPGLNRLFIVGWAMYAVSFVLPMKDMDLWGYDAFWAYFKVFFDFEEKDFYAQ